LIEGRRFGRTGHIAQNPCDHYPDSLEKKRGSPRGAEGVGKQWRVRIDLITDRDFDALSDLVAENWVA
jgi:hypothetical protein